MNEQLNLAQRIAKAASSVGGKLSADKRNKEQNYDYISSDKMLSVIGQAMAENGVVVFPSVIENQMIIGQTSGGKSRYDVSVKFEMMVSDGVTTLTMPWLGVGNDYSAPDKATYKAITSGHKYFLAKLFCIGVGNEDSEHEIEEPVQRRQSAPKPVMPATTKPVISETNRKRLHALGTELYGDGWEAKRHEIVLAVTKERTNSSNDLFEDEAKIIIDGMEDKKKSLRRAA